MPLDLELDRLASAAPGSETQSLPKEWSADWHLLQTSDKSLWQSVPGKLYWDSEQLSYYSTAMASKGLRPLSFDFAEQWKTFMRQKRSAARGPLFRALGKAQTIIDATCGSGKDALIFLSWDLKVYSFERSPFIYFLLKDAQRIWYTHRPTPLPWQIQLGDLSQLPQQSREFAAQAGTCLYYDPMYPHDSQDRKHRKGALARKEMEVFREILNQPEAVHEAEHFLTHMLSQAWERIVVKRPLQAEVLLADQWASFQQQGWHYQSFEGKSVRYDRYWKS